MSFITGMIIFKYKRVVIDVLLREIRVRGINRIEQTVYVSLFSF